MCACQEHVRVSIISFEHTGVYFGFMYLQLFYHNVLLYSSSVFFIQKRITSDPSHLSQVRNVLQNLHVMTHFVLIFLKAEGS